MPRFLTIVAVTGGTQKRGPGRFELNATAYATSSPLLLWRAWHCYSLSREFHALASSQLTTGDKVWASRASSQRPSGCLW